MAELDRVLMVSHEDFDPYASVSVAFDEEMNFNVCLEYDFSGEPELNYKKTAVIDRENAYALAKRKKVGLSHLAELFEREFYGEDFFYDTTDVENLFAEVLDYLLDNGVTFRMERTEG